MTTPTDSIVLSQQAVDGLSAIGIGDFTPCELPERMAWIALVLRSVPDNPLWFPRGKWATIQHIHKQVEDAAAVVAAGAIAGP